MLLLVAAVGSRLVAPAAAADLETVRAQAQEVADDISSIEQGLAKLEDKRARLEQRIENIDVELAELGLTVSRWNAAERAARAEYERQAIEAYKSGGTINLDVLLTSETLGDVFDLIEVHAQLTAGYASTATEVANASDSALAARSQIDERKQQSLAAARAIDVVEERLRASLRERRTVLADLTDRLEVLEARARAEAERVAATAGISASDALLDVLGGSGPAARIPDGFAPTGVSFEGLASWYGPGFEGNYTANGDIFDSSLYTAASKELPLPTWLYVEYEGRGVVVYVNDRGPYVGERILDLSRAAAEAIGLTGPGVGWVKAHILLPN